MPFKDKTKRIEYARQYHLKHKEKCNLRSLSYYQNHKEEHNKRVEKYLLANKEKIVQYQKEYRIKNSEVNKEYSKNYYIINKEKFQKYNKDNLEYSRAYESNREKTDIQFLLRKRLRSRLFKAIRNNQKVGSAVRDLGCTIPELKMYLEGQFKDGMTWDNWSLKGWHIDHKVPLAFFDLTKREQFLQAVHYSNLQPLWAEENLIKRSKIYATPTR